MAAEDFGSDTLTDLERAREVAVALEQDNAELQRRATAALTALSGLEERSRETMRQPKPNPAAYVSGLHDAYFTALKVARAALAGDAS